MSKILFRDKAAQTSNKKCFSSQKRLHKKKNEKTGKIIMPKSNIPMRIYIYGQSRSPCQLRCSLAELRADLPNVKTGSHVILLSLFCSLRQLIPHAVLSRPRHPPSCAHTRTHIHWTTGLLAEFSIIPRALPSSTLREYLSLCVL